MKTTTKPLSGSQGLAFQPHALQIVLFGPFTYEPTIMCGSLRIVSLQLASSVGRLARWHRWWRSQASVKQGLAKAPPFPATRCCCPDINFHEGLGLAVSMAWAALRASNIKLTPPTLVEGLVFEKKKKLLKRKNTSFGQNQGLVWSSDSSLWGNQLLKRKNTSFGQNQGLVWSSDSSL